MLWTVFRNNKKRNLSLADLPLSDKWKNETRKTFCPKERGIISSTNVTPHVHTHTEGGIIFKKRALSSFSSRTVSVMSDTQMMNE